MEAGPVFRVITILLCVAAAFFVAETITNLVLVLSGLAGPAALVTGIVLFAAVFFSVLHVLGKYSGIRIFGSGPG